MTKLTLHSRNAHGVVDAMEAVGAEVVVEAGVADPGVADACRERNRCWKFVSEHEEATGSPHLCGFGGRPVEWHRPSRPRQNCASI